MAIVLSIFGIAIAAFCVWLTVRIVNRRERWAKWTLASVFGVPLLYVLSFGPACWWFSTYEPPTVPSFAWGEWPYAPCIYWPFGWLSAHGPQPIRDTINWYATRRSEVVMLPNDWEGKWWDSSN